MDAGSAEHQLGIVIAIAELVLGAPGIDVSGIGRFRRWVKMQFVIEPI